MEKGRNATGVRETEKKKKQEGLKRGQSRKDPEETRISSTICNGVTLIFFFFFAEQKYKYLTKPARLPFSSHQYSHYSTRAVSGWRDATVLMRYGQINGE